MKIGERSDPEVVQIVGESMGYRGTRVKLVPRFFIDFCYGEFSLFRKLQTAIYLTFSS